MSARSSQLQGGETEQREDDREDHEPRDDLRLAPADELEVVVQRRHSEDALAGELEGSDLQHDRRRLDDEDAADDDEDEFLLDEQRDGPERAAERERADVAHEDVGGVRVVPEEAETGADERATEDRQLADEWRDPGDQQVV